MLETAPADPRVGVLGAVVVMRGGVVTSVRSRHQRLILALLVAAAGRVVSTDELVDALWGDELPADPPAALQAQIFRLRRLLGPAGEWLQTAGTSGYRLAGGPDRIDAERFAALFARARSARTASVATLADIDAALGLWRGRAYMDVDHGAVLAPAAALAEQQAEAAELRAELLMALDRPPEAAQAMEVLCAEHPLRERPVALRMRALARTGRHADALAAFDAFRRTIRTELGLDPSPILCAVQQEILRPPVPTLRPAPAVGLPGNSFVGREAELETVRESMTRSRLVTLTGPGGIGKTRLALHAAVSVAHRYGDGVCLCELAAVTTSDGVAAAVASILRITERAGQSHLDRVVEFLTARQMLLVLDNCEHVPAAVTALVSALIAHAPDVSVLATSRQRLGVPGEQRLPLEPLPTPAGDDVAGPAVVLFGDRAAAVRPDFTLTSANLAAVCELCRRLEGLPLGIELAAARTVSRSPAEILAEITGRLTQLADRRRPLERHRSIEAVVGWSYDLLQPDERAVAERLAVFAGGFTAPSAAAVLDVDGGELLDRLTALVEHSLLSVREVGGRTRFSILEPVRQYAEERLSDRHLLEVTRARHATWAVDLAERAHIGLLGPEEANWVRTLHEEFANLRAAHRWCLENDGDASVRLAAALRGYGFWHGPSEVGSWAEEAVERFAGTDHPLLPTALATASGVASKRGELARASGFARRGVELAGGDVQRGRFAFEALADTRLWLGEFEAALPSYDLAVRGNRAAGDRASEAIVAAARALMQAYAGNLAGARATMAEGAEVIAAADNPSAQAFCSYVTGEIELDEQPELALAYLRHSVELARNAGNGFIAAVAGVSAASCEGRHFDPAAALARYADLIDYWQRAGAWNHQWITIRTLIEVLTRLGRDEPAAVLHGALSASTTASPIVGRDAERLADAVTRMRDALGDVAFSRLHEEGAELGDDRAVSYASSCLGGGM